MYNLTLNIRKSLLPSKMKLLYCQSVGEHCIREDHEVTSRNITFNEPVSHYIPTMQEFVCQFWEFSSLYSLGLLCIFVFVATQLRIAFRSRTDHEPH